MMNSMPVVSSGCCTKAVLVLGGGALPVRFSLVGWGAAACVFAAVFVAAPFAEEADDALDVSSFQRVRGFGAPNASRAAELADADVPARDGGAGFIAAASFCRAALPASFTRPLAKRKASLASSLDVAASSFCTSASRASCAVRALV